jgi:hypothetical protein
MNKADYTFHRDKKQAIQASSRQTDEPFFRWGGAANSPIFTPKRKKKK